MGGPATCTTMFTGATAQEIVDSGMKHVAEAHPEMMADIKNMTPEATAKWMEEFHAKFDALPEMPAAGSVTPAA